MHDPKIASLAERMNNMTIASNVTVNQAANAHINCLVNLAVQDAGGDEKKAAGILRHAMEQMIIGVYDPSIRRKIQVVAGKIVDFIKPANDN